MKLLTAEIRARLPKLYATDGVPADKKMLQAKFFFPAGRATWFATEFDGEDEFFGYVVSPLGEDCDEWGYFSLKELEGVRRGPLKVERDIYWQPKTFAEEFKI